MSTEAVASWLRVRKQNALVGQFWGKGVRRSLDDLNKPKGNALLAGRKSAQPLHHRIYWREETSSGSLWEGTLQAIEGALLTEGSRKEPLTCGIGDEATQHQVPKKSGRLSPAVAIRQISKASDLQRLSRMLNDRRINTSSSETFAAALRDANPAVVEMWLQHGKKHKGDYFLDTFHSWGKTVGDADVIGDGSGGTRPPQSVLPLHVSSHAGSPEIVSVLLRFIADTYSCEDLKAMVNARDINGRTALHLASWSPRLHGPGKRKYIVRSLLSHGADVKMKDYRGRTALHEACRATDRFVMEMLLESGANPLDTDDRGLTPIETASTRRHRRLLETIFRDKLPTARYRRLCAKTTAKAVVTRIMQRVVPLCITCRVRPAQTCRDLKRENFAIWVFKHKRWPKAEEGKWQEVRPSCVEWKRATGNNKQ
ncbi:unnamed protein product [Scytosiphon promiscuus]